MALCMCEKISSADCFVLGAIQIMIGIFCFLMWYLLFTLYWGQFEGVFGIYDPVTYKTGSSLWGIFFIISGASIIRAAIYSTQKHVMVSIIANSVSVLIALSILCLTIVELSTFHSVSYRNFGQAKLGRRISSILISFYLMELAITFIYSTIMSANMETTIQRVNYRNRPLDSHTVTMPGYYLHIKKETRMLGAIQIMNGLFLSSLGQLWIYLFVTQMYAIGKNYPHIVISTGYPFWSSMLFILSGIFTVLLEKWRLKVLKSFAIVVNAFCVCISGLGAFLILLELLASALITKNPNWAQRSGRILTEYVAMFTFLQFVVSSLVIYWAVQATYTYS